MEYYIEKIRSSGLKVTPRRKAIIELFMSRDTHLTPEEVWGTLSKQFKQCGLPSVYRNLESLVECGVLTRILQFDRQKHYGLCTCRDGKHHHHIVCVKCGRIDEIDECALEHTTRLKGYQVISHYVQINGICSQCH